MSDKEKEKKVKKAACCNFRLSVKKDFLSLPFLVLREFLRKSKKSFSSCRWLPENGLVFSPFLLSFPPPFSAAHPPVPIIAV